MKNERERDVDKVLAEALYSGPIVTADQLVGVDSCLRQLAGQLRLVEQPELMQRYPILGYRGGGGDGDIDDATALIIQVLDAGDPALGPSRATIERHGPPGAAVGSIEMRTTAWHLARLRYGECLERTRGLVAENRFAIEHLARLLLTTKNRMGGDETVAAIESAEKAA